MAGSHEFAVYHPEIILLAANRQTSIIITDESLYHRLSTVLRLVPGQVVTFFDKQHHVQGIIHAFEKKRVKIEVQSYTANTIFEPSITVGLPVLKKDDMSQAVELLTAVGVTAIQIITTQKVQRSFGGVLEHERLKRVAIAAAEQSKNYALPALYSPISLENFVVQYARTNVQRYFFDPQGQSFNVLAQRVIRHPREPVVLVIGPEGDLIEAEKHFLSTNNYAFFALTPTILRASYAVGMAVGFIRACTVG